MGYNKSSETELSSNFTVHLFWGGKHSLFDHSPHSSRYAGLLNYFLLPACYFRTFGFDSPGL